MVRSARPLELIAGYPCTEPWRARTAARCGRLARQVSLRGWVDGLYQPDGSRARAVITSGRPSARQSTMQRLHVRRLGCRRSGQTPLARGRAAVGHAPVIHAHVAGHRASSADGAYGSQRGRESDDSSLVRTPSAPAIPGALLPAGLLVFPGRPKNRVGGTAACHRRALPATHPADSAQPGNGRRATRLERKKGCPVSGTYAHSRRMRTSLSSG